MDLKVLEAFCRVVELKSFSRGAEAVSLSQPTVSAHIKSLEAEVGLRLLDRAGRSVTPTRAGELLYGHARRILAIRDEARRALAEHKGGLAGHLTIGGSSIPGAYVLPALVAAFKRQHPAVTLALTIGDSRGVARGVMEGRLEAGVIGAKFEEGRLRFETFVEDELVLAVPAAHPWARRAAVRPAELAEEPLVMRERGSGTRKVMEEALAARGVEPASLRVILEVSSNEAVRQAVKAGAGLAVISRRAIADDVRYGEMAGLRIQGIDLRRDFYLATHQSRGRSPLTEAFLTFLRREGAGKFKSTTDNRQRGRRQRRPPGG
jgi:DNA-binding transcriptional LysR family regulator